MSDIICHDCRFLRLQFNVQNELTWFVTCQIYSTWPTDDISHRHLVSNVSKLERIYAHAFRQLWYLTPEEIQVPEPCRVRPFRVAAPFAIDFTRRRDAKLQLVYVRGIRVVEWSSNTPPLTNARDWTEDILFWRPGEGVRS